MSDVSQGPGWWLASDGRWYPPEAVPGGRGPAEPPPSPTAAPPSSGRKALLGRWWVWTACAAVVLLVVVAAGTFKAAPGKATKVGTAHGYTRFADRTDSFSIAVPSSWRQVNPSSPGAQAAFAQVMAASPSLKKAFGGGFAGLAASGIKFLAVDPDPADAATGSPTINVIVHPAPGSKDADLQQLASGIEAEYQQLGLHTVDSATVELAGHRALRVHVAYTTSAPDGSSTTVPETQYFVLANDFAYVVTLGFSSPSFDQVLASFSVRQG
jgi:hypothetical protein